MRLATIKLHGAEVAGIVTGKGILPVAALNAYKGTGWKEDMMSLIQANHIPGLTRWYNEGGKEELEEIDICGIAGDYCVLESLKDALRTFPNMNFKVLGQFTASIDDGKTLSDFVNSSSRVEFA